jgi:threonine/homoserine/homoserine lactone efflux protein
MQIQTWLAFAMVTAVVSYTPGPNMLLSLSHGLLHGPRRTLATACGLLVGLWLLMAASTAGLGAILATSATAFQVVKWCGVAYLAWLGFRLWRSPSAGDALADRDDALRAATPRQMATQAFFVALSNPKAIIYFTALFPQFIDPSRPLLGQVLILATTFSLIEFCMIMSTATGAGRLAPWLSRGSRGRWINRASGSVLLAAAALLAAARRL